MSPKQKLLFYFQALIFILLTSSILFYPPINNTNATNMKIKTNPGNSSIFEIGTDEGSYFADINWVKTNINLNKNGLGLVTLIINCTPTEDHFGIYIRPLPSGEVKEVIPEDTYAINDGQNLVLNYTLVNNLDLSFRIYIDDPELLNENETIQYYLSYTADFFISDQIKHYEVDTELAIVDLLRPYWDGDLEFQELNITLPINVGQSTVTQAKLDEFKFRVADYMIGLYDLIYSTKEIDDEFLLVFSSRKVSMQPLGSFQVQFFVSISYFSLPVAINWLAGLLISIFVVGSVSILLIVITFRKRAKTEIEDFKSGLYNLIDSDES